MALIHPNSVEAVVAIGTTEEEWYGTGFFYASEYKDGGLPYLVTNQHIIDSLIEDEKKKICLKYISYVNDTIYLLDLNLFDKEDNPNFYCHPDKDIDLAVIPVNYKKIKESMGVRLIGHNASCKIKEMRDNGISEGDPVFVLGFPMGNLTINKGSVIVRNGSIARIRDVFWGESKSFLIDSFIFPGNSGGPVFLVPQNGAIEGTSTIKQSYLIGVVKEYLAYEDVARSEQTGQPRVIFTENSGLALVHPMDYIEEVINIHKKKISH
jgi:S1-C subfamily serine protease